MKRTHSDTIVQPRDISPIKSYSTLGYARAYSGNLGSHWGHGPGVYGGRVSRTSLEGANGSANSPWFVTAFASRLVHFDWYSAYHDSPGIPIYCHKYTSPGLDSVLADVTYLNYVLEYSAINKGKVTLDGTYVDGGSYPRPSSVVMGHNVSLADVVPVSGYEHGRAKRTLPYSIYGRTGVCADSAKTWTNYGNEIVDFKRKWNLIGTTQTASSVSSMGLSSTGSQWDNCGKTVRSVLIGVGGDLPIRNMYSTNAKKFDRLFILNTHMPLDVLGPNILRPNGETGADGVGIKGCSQLRGISTGDGFESYMNYYIAEKERVATNDSFLGGRGSHTWADQLAGGFSDRAYDIDHLIEKKVLKREGFIIESVGDDGNSSRIRPTDDIGDLPDCIADVYALGSVSRVGIVSNTSSEANPTENFLRKAHRLSSFAKTLPLIRVIMPGQFAM